MELHEATPEEVRLVYERDLVEAFPYEELRTLPEIEELIRQGKYKFLCLYDGPEIVASVAFYQEKPGWILWDYLYVVPSRRHSWLGLYLVRDMTKRYHDSVIIADVESPEYAPDPSFARKRIALFRRTGAFVTGFEVELWGVRYKVIYWADRKHPDNEIMREYDHICRTMFTSEEHERYIRIPF